MSDTPTFASESSLFFLPPQSRLGHYTILKVLGHGGFGITYLVHDDNLNCNCVLKENMPRMFCERNSTTMRVSALAGEDTENAYRWSLERFRDEAQTLARLNHPNIVRVRDYFDELGTSYYVMDVIEGEELHIATQSRRDEALLRHVLGRLLSALKYMHGKEILHRDIKPSNVLLTPEGEPVLIDFGTARSLISNHTHTQVKSRGYTPLEQIQKKAQVGPYTDLYALGATFCHVLTGQCPPDCVDRISVDEFVPLADREELQAAYSQCFLSSIDKALKTNANERWQTADEWSQALEAPETTRHGESAEETYKRQLEEYNRKMEVYNRQMEEYTRRMNETKAVNAETAVPPAAETEAENAPETAVAVNNSPEELRSAAEVGAEKTKYDIFEAIDHNSWHELMMALTEEKTPSRRRKNKQSPKTYAEKKEASKEICNFLQKKDDKIRTFAEMYSRLSQGGYEAVCQYIEEMDKESMTPGDIVFCGKQYDVETLLGEAGAAGCEKAARMLIEGLRKRSYGIEPDLGKAYSAAKRIAACKRPWAAELLQNVKNLYFGRLYNVILAWYMLYLLLAIFLFDGMWLVVQIVPAVFCLVRQWDKIPFEENREHWRPYIWDGLPWDMAILASIGLLGIYGLIIIVHAFGSMPHVDYVTEYVVCLSICMTLAFRSYPCWESLGYNIDDGVTFVVYGALTLIGLIGLCFLSPFATRLANGASAMANLCLYLIILNIVPTAWGLLVSPRHTVRCYHGLLIAGCVLFFCLIGFVRLT